MRTLRSTRTARYKGSPLISRSLGDTDGGGGGMEVPPNGYVSESGVPYVVENGLDYYVTES